MLRVEWDYLCPAAFANASSSAIHTFHHAQSFNYESQLRGTLLGLDVQWVPHRGSIPDLGTFATFLTPTNPLFGLSIQTKNTLQSIVNVAMKVIISGEHPSVHLLYKQC